MPDLRTQRRVSRLAIALSAVLHALLIAALVFFAAREGMLGNQLKKFAVTIIAKDKPPEKPREKPPELKSQLEPPKSDLAREVAAPPAEIPKAAARSAPSAVAPAAAPVVAPPVAEVASFDFEGGHRVESSSDPDVLYKGFVEYTLRSHWTRPEGLADLSFVAEADLDIDSGGRVMGYNWIRGSGDIPWDASVKKVLSETRAIGRPPPKGFPSKVRVRFDTQEIPQIVE